MLERPQLFAGDLANVRLRAAEKPNPVKGISRTLESIQNVASYDEGSGRGRLVQYERSLRMAAAHPLFGVGPGNWPVVYPKFAADNDPSMNGSERLPTTSTGF